MKIEKGKFIIQTGLNSWHESEGLFTWNSTLDISKAMEFDSEKQALELAKNFTYLKIIPI